MTCRLLERALSVFGESAGDRFEILAMRCQALHQVDCLIHDQGSDSPTVLLAQSRWVVASIGRDGLKRMLAESITEAKRMFDLIGQPTAVQDSLKEALTRIASVHRE